ncbi:MAG: xanthine dehydrogenase small subunit [Pseudomonadota bacterium]
MTRSEIRFVHGGSVTTLSNIAPTQTVLEYLREDLRLTGTKEGCAEGDCGACTVIVGRLTDAGAVEFEALNACILFLACLDGAWLITVEDLIGPDGELHPVQQMMADHHGSQCGFCTPGFVMMLLAYQLSEADGDLQTINSWLAGNLCRCTGYGPIQNSAKQVAGTEQPAWFQQRIKAVSRLMGDWSRTAETVDLNGPKGRFVAPASASALAQHVKEYPDATLVAGATDVGLWVTKQLRDFPHLVTTKSASDLAKITVTDQAFEIGGAASYTDAVPVLLADYPEAATMFDRLGAVQVRNAGTIGGNIANGSPIGDSPPFLIAARARLGLRRGDERREIPLEDFFIEYGRQDLQPGEFVEAVLLPRRNLSDRFGVYKISKRRDQDISSVLAALTVRIDRNTGHCVDARLAFGGLAGTPALARHAMAALVGEHWSLETIETAKEALGQDFSPLSDHRASAWYRLEVAGNLLERFFYETAERAPQEAAHA